MSENTGSAKAKEETMEQTHGRGKKQSRTRKSSQSSEPSLNMAELHELAHLVDEHGFTDFEFENANIRVRLSKNLVSQQYIQTAQPVTQTPVSSSTSTAFSPSKESKLEAVDSETKTDEDLHKIPSPIVGTFYRSPAPDKEPYVKEGAVVSPDTIVCIVEAMKLMNEIEAEVSGEVVKIYVENGQPVEYGQPLFGIRK